MPWCFRGDLTVIASHRVGAKRRPMTGSAKQSMSHAILLDGLLRFAMTVLVFVFHRT
jgi:hypothetical protein